MHVGVFLQQWQAILYNVRLPHACGGVSTLYSYTKVIAKSSPCMWGCFQNFAISPVKREVFPMHVGVFLFHALFICVWDSLPHACGGVSLSTVVTTSPFMSSPCMWGCFQSHDIYEPEEGVFPMHVGVFLTYIIIIVYIGSLPHACGGVSVNSFLTFSKSASSPCMWGCFL